MHFFAKKTANLLANTAKVCNFAAQKPKNGGLAQLARALAWHARGHRFEPDILHKKEDQYLLVLFLFYMVNSE